MDPFNGTTDDGQYTSGQILNEKPDEREDLRKLSPITKRDPDCGSLKTVFIYYRVKVSLFYDVLVYSGSSKNKGESKRKCEHCQGREDQVKALFGAFSAALLNTRNAGRLVDVLVFLMYDFIIAFSLKFREGPISGLATILAYTCGKTSGAF
ncbi:hypothetical protein EDD85DRAFT_795187 [Armillaria nabsnona]|nr:hypothetical protein EDD85DRAFT_795187 [Armillaria nabsnona]